jgi:hypothetical protein
MTYFSIAQLPKSIARQRSLQNGASGSLRLTGFWQIGHFIADFHPHNGLAPVRLTIGFSPHNGLAPVRLIVLGFG